MARIIGALVVAISLLGICLAEDLVAVPSRTIIATLDVEDLFSELNDISDARYSGRLGKTCDGGPFDMSLDSISVQPSYFIGPHSGQYGVALDLNVEASIEFCHYSGQIVCRSKTKIAGDLIPLDGASGICTAPQFRLFTVAFPVMESPRIIRDSVVVKLPNCDTGGEAFSCLEWPSANRSEGTVPSSDRERTLSANTRLFGAPRDFGGKNSSTGTLEWLSIVLHVGERYDLVVKKDDLSSAKLYASPPPHGDDEFGLWVNLASLQDTYFPDGRVADKGLLSQFFPILVSGRDRIALLGEVDYTATISTLSLYRAMSRGDEVLVLEFEASDPVLTKIKNGKVIRPFRSFRVRAFIDDLTIVENKLHISIRELDAKFVGLLGFINLGTRTSLLNSQFEQLISGSTLLELNSSFDIALPRCIALEGEHTNEDIKACSKLGLIRHTKGSRGIRGTLVQTNSSYDDGVFYFGGEISVEPIMFEEPR